MRLWHWKLVPALPRRQLLGQWRECCLIAKNIHELGTPNHILVDPIMEYSLDNFLGYCHLIADEIFRRGYTCDKHRLLDALYGEPSENDIDHWDHFIHRGNLFAGWHSNRYFWQCYYNLEEKHDRGGITKTEWERVQSVVNEYLCTNDRNIFQDMPPIDGELDS